MKNNETSRSADRHKGLPIKSVMLGAAWGGVLGLVLLFLAMPSYASSRHAPPRHAPSKFSPDLMSSIGPNGMVTVNVQYRSFPTAGYLKGRQSAGATLRWKLRTITAVTMTVPASMLPTLASEANVVYISPDRSLSMTGNPVT